MLLWPFRIVVAVILLIDEFARPLYRPMLDWIATWRMMARFTAAVASLPRLTILILFAVPFAIAEPLKLFALVLIARGRIIIGIALLVLAYLMTFLLVERIYHAGRQKLLTYPWFEWAMRQIGQVRNALLKFKAESVTRLRAWLRIPG
ncbi:MAG: hypothetical protein JWM58_283 [Rhizobium sp.]|nr:hypothetical protein [Rhizobium sp.]